MTSVSCSCTQVLLLNTTISCATLQAVQAVPALQATRLMVALASVLGPIVIMGILVVVSTSVQHV